MRFLDRFEEWAIIVLLGLMTILVFVSTMARYVFFFPITWGEEAARYMMVWLAYVGASAGLKKGSHLGVEAFVSALPKKWRPFLDALRYVIIIVFNVLVVILAAQIMRNQFDTGQTSPALEIPIYWAYAAIPFGACLMIVRSVQHLIGTIANRRQEGWTYGSIAFRRVCCTHAAQHPNSCGIGPSVHGSPVLRAHGHTAASGCAAHVHGCGFFPVHGHSLLHAGRRPNGGGRDLQEACELLEDLGRTGARRTGHHNNRLFSVFWRDLRIQSCHCGLYRRHHDSGHDQGRISQAVCCRNSGRRRHAGRHHTA